MGIADSLARLSTGLVSQIASIDWACQPLLAGGWRNFFAIFFLQMAQAASQGAIEQKMLEKVFDNRGGATVEQIAVFAATVAIGGTTWRRQTLQSTASMAAL